MYFFMQGGIELNMSEIYNNKINKQADDDKQENMLKQNTNEYKNSQQVDYTDNNATSVKASTKSAGRLCWQKRNYSKKLH